MKCNNRFLNVFQGLPENGENAGKKATPAIQGHRWVMNVLIETALNKNN